MTTLLHRDFAFATRSLDEAKRAVRVIASTDAVDSYGEILVQDWDLNRYLENPVVLWGHDATQAPIGFGSDVAVEDGKLTATLNFVTREASAKAEEVWQGIKQGSIRGISVGFRSKKAESRDINGRSVFVLTGNELVEISVVTIGANPEAVIERARSMRAIRELAGVRDAHAGGGVDLLARVRELEAQLEAQLEEQRPLAEEVRTLRASTESSERSRLLTRGHEKRNVWPAIEQWAESLTVDQLRFYVEHMPAHPVLARSSEQEPQHTPATIMHNGKTWEQMKPMERQHLYFDNHDLYEAMRNAAGETAHG